MPWGGGGGGGIPRTIKYKCVSLTMKEKPEKCQLSLTMKEKPEKCQLSLTMKEKPEKCQLSLTMKEKPEKCQFRPLLRQKDAHFSHGSINKTVGIPLISGQLSSAVSNKEFVVATTCTP